MSVTNLRKKDNIFETTYFMALTDRTGVTGGYL